MANANSQFGGFLTNVGLSKQTNANALGIPWKITTMMLGDGGGEPALYPDPIPSPTQTALVHQVYAAQLNGLYQSPDDPAVLIAELVLPPTVGGWWIRESALKDEDGDLIAVAAPAPSYKPLLVQGSGRTQTIRMHVLFGNIANIQLKVDPSVVLATRAYVDGLTIRADQTEAEAGTDNSKIMTPLRVFQAIAKVVVQATETAFGWAKVATQAQVTTGTDDATIVTPKKLRAAQATQVEAETGTDNSKIMTPLRVFQAIAKVVVQATETAFGWAKVATQAQVTTGTDDATIVTPNKLRAAQATQVEAETGTDNSKIMTPLRVFQAIAKVVVQATETAFGWAKVATQAQVTTGTDDATIVTPKKLRAAQATQVEAETGTDNSKIMTPLRVFQAIDKVVVQATETAFGWAKIASQDQTDAGVDDSTIVTPKKLRAGFSVLFAANGYLAFPSWLGGFILQWGQVTQSVTSVTVTYPIQFPTSIYGVLANVTEATSSYAFVQAVGWTVTGFLTAVYSNTPSTAPSTNSLSATVNWLAFGR